MVRPGTLTRAAPATWVKGPSRALALAAADCEETLTSSTRPASLGAAAAVARMGVVKRRKDCAFTAASAETGRVVEVVGTPGPAGEPPVAVPLTMVSEEFNCKPSTRK